MNDAQAATQPEPAPHVDPPPDDQEGGSLQQDAPSGAVPGGTTAITQAQANAPSLAAGSPDASPAGPAWALAGKILDPDWTPSGGKVTLAPVPPLGSVTLPPLEDGGEGLVIDAAGTEVDADTARRAQEAALKAGCRLQEL